MTKNIYWHNLFVLSLGGYVVMMSFAVQAQNSQNSIKTIQITRTGFVDHSDSVVGSIESSFIRYSKKGDTIEYRKLLPLDYGKKIKGKIRNTRTKKIVKEKIYSRTLQMEQKTKRIYDLNENLLYEECKFKLEKNSGFYTPYKKWSNKLYRDESGKLVSKHHEGIYSSKARTNRLFNQYTEYEYDSLGNLIQAVCSGNIKIYKYSRNGSVAEFTIQSNGDTTLRSFVSIQYTDTTKIRSDLLKKHTYTYSLNGNLIAFYDSIKQIGWTKTMDSYGRNIQTTNYKNDSIWFQWKNTFDNQGLLIKQISEDGIVYLYEYNDEQKLISSKKEEDFNVHDVQYEYDDNGLIVIERHIVSASYGKQRWEICTLREYY